MINLVKHNWRFLLMSFGLIGLGVSLCLKMTLLQVFDTGFGVGFLKRQGDNRTIRTETVEAYRGMITDRRGVPLAISTPVVSIWVDPKFFDASEGQLESLANILEKDSDAIRARIQKYQSKRFVYLKKGVAPYDADDIDALGIKGVHRDTTLQRFYPAGEVTANLLGYTNYEGKGLEGVEYAYNDWLIGSPGHKKVVQDLYGRTIKVLGQPQDPEPGKDISLSIDLRLQFLAHKALKKAVNYHRAASGSIVVLDNNTGEVLAMASQPSFNPNDRSEMRLSDVKNRAISDVFEPGSTAKPLSMLAILESGKFAPQDIINTHPGYIRLGKKTLIDPVDYGKISVGRIITKSSQVGMSKLALALEPTDIPLMMDRLELGKFIGTGMPGEHPGFVPHDLYWSKIERAALSYGYGLTVNSLQLARAYAVVAADGKAYPLSLIKLTEQPKSSQIVAPALAQDVKAMLATVTGREGTGKRARTSAYSVAGKTGTSHKVGEGGYELKYISLFAGMAPVKDPKITVVVSIDDPKGSHYFGGEVAAPVFSSVVAGSLRLLDVPPDLLVSRFLNGSEGGM